MIYDLYLAQKTLKRLEKNSSKGSGFTSYFADARGIELLSNAKKDGMESEYFKASSGFASVKPK